MKIHFEKFEVITENTKRKNSLRNLLCVYTNSARCSETNIRKQKEVRARLHHLQIGQYKILL